MSTELENVTLPGLAKAYTLLVAELHERGIIHMADTVKSLDSMATLIQDRPEQTQGLAVLRDYLKTTHRDAMLQPSSPVPRGSPGR